MPSHCQERLDPNECKMVKGRCLVPFYCEGKRDSEYQANFRSGQRPGMLGIRSLYLDKSTLVVGGGGWKTQLVSLTSLHLLLLVGRRSLYL